MKNKKSKKYFLICIFQIIILLIIPSIQSVMLFQEKEFSLIESKQVNKTIQNSSIIIHPHIHEMLNRVDKSVLKKHVQTIQDFGPHPTGSDELELVGDYIFKELIKTGLSVEWHSWSSGEKSGKNIIATLPGISKTDGIVIICAHYDSIRVSPGADDDGSGVASILMIADIMSDYFFNATVKFILFSGEEQGLLGSKAYAEMAFENGDNIIGVVALDKIGYAVTSEEGMKIVHHSNIESGWMVYISKIISELYFDIIGLNIVHYSQDPGSDHLSFVQFGYDGTDFVRYAINPFYHTSEDIIDHMNMTYLGKACGIALGTLTSIASLSPVLTADDFEIAIKGTYLSEPAQVSIRIDNKRFREDTANVTIKIKMKHIIRDEYVSAIKKHYNIPCNWSLTKEIGEYWEFLIDGRKYSKGFFRLEVTIHGIKDDVNLYMKRHTFGMILNPIKIVLLPIY